MKKTFLFLAAMSCAVSLMAKNIGDTIRYEYEGNNLFYVVSSLKEGKFAVDIAPELSDSPYYTDANKPSGALVLPDTVEDDLGVKYAVTTMRQHALRNSKITSFTNNNIIKDFGFCSVRFCSSLAIVDLKNATYIYDYAFDGDPIQTITMDKVISIGMSNFSSAKFTTVHISKNLTNFDTQSYLFHSRVKKIEVDAENPVFMEKDGVVYKRLSSSEFNCIVGCVKDTNYVVTIPECVDTMLYRAMESSKLDVIMPKNKAVGVKDPTDSRNAINGLLYVNCPLHDAYVARSGLYKSGKLVDTLLYTIDLVAENGTIELSDTTDCNQVTLTPKAAAGYQFTQWSDGNMDNPRIVIVDSDTTYTAQFEVATRLDAPTQSAATHKLIENGQLFILYEGKKFNILGAETK